MSWTESSASLLAKLISQLCTEDLLQPDGDRLVFGAATYTFTSTRGGFGSYQVIPGSVRRTAAGILGNDESEEATDPVQFLVDAAEALGLSGSTVAGYVAELSSTLAADVQLASTALPNASLVGLSHTALEGHLTGHPLLVANKGRLGFSAADSLRYTPEARTPLRLVWLAVRRGLAEFRGTPELSEHAVLKQELGSTWDSFRSQLVDPDSYVWLPCHPWQLDHVVATQWARELATGEIIVLGEGPDDYLPTQSIRTMVNTSNPGRYQVKLPLKILNTSVYRGIPPHCSLAAPMVTQWLRGLWYRDEVFNRLGTELLGEVASVTVRHPQLSSGVPYQWTETLGCIWRDPLTPRLRSGETAWPLAAVLHRDVNGEPLVAALIGDTDATVWLAELISTLVRPLLHLMHHYGITVNPHGENLSIICGPDGLPARLVIKDLIDDVNISTEPIPARGPEPDSHDRVLPRKPWHILRQYLVDALFLGVLNPLADLQLIAPDQLWGILRGEIEEYARAHPQYEDRLEATALLGETFARYPLNGYRLTLGYTDLVTRPPIPVTGRMPNPLHGVKSIRPVREW
ncbi:IucA/IucC family protein [Kribbella sp. NPDC051620]|uniref:IucA/IucC family protein n=1 Tax=Kribbella sp. NPDC051620 TaxID=3364120 RepID=UPI003797CEA2